MRLKQRLGAILRALAITEIEYSLSGGGDSGESTLERVTYENEGDRTHLPDIPIFITDAGKILHLPDLLESIVVDAPDETGSTMRAGMGPSAFPPSR